MFNPEELILSTETVTLLKASAVSPTWRVKPLPPLALPAAEKSVRTPALLVTVKPLSFWIAAAISS